MLLKELTYSCGQTLQLRSYEPTNVHFSAKAEVGEGDDPKIVFAELKALVDKEIEIQVTMLQGNSGKLIREAAKSIIKKQESPF